MTDLVDSDPPPAEPALMFPSSDQPAPAEKSTIPHALAIVTITASAAAYVPAIDPQLLALSEVDQAGLNYDQSQEADSMQHQTALRAGEELSATADGQNAPADERPAFAGERSAHVDEQPAHVDEQPVHVADQAAVMDDQGSEAGTSEASEDDPAEVDDLPASRAQLDQKLKLRFEDIFRKYGRDFEGVGDEIDLNTGVIVVDNGHLAGMTTTASAERDILDAFTEYGGSSAESNSESDGEHDDDFASQYSSEDDIIFGGRLAQSIESESLPQQGDNRTAHAVPDVDDIMEQFGPELGPKIIAYISAQQSTEDIEVEPAWQIPAFPHPSPYTGSASYETQQNAAQYSRNSLWNGPEDNAMLPPQIEPAWQAPPLPETPRANRRILKSVLMQQEAERSPTPVADGDVWAPIEGGIRVHEKNRMLPWELEAMEKCILGGHKRNLRLQKFLIWQEFEKEHPQRTAAAWQTAARRYFNDDNGTLERQGDPYEGLARVKERTKARHSQDAESFWRLYGQYCRLQDRDPKKGPPYKFWEFIAEHNPKYTADGWRSTYYRKSYAVSAEDLERFTRSPGLPLILTRPLEPLKRRVRPKRPPWKKKVGKPEVESDVQENPDEAAEADVNPDTDLGSMLNAEDSPDIEEHAVNISSNERSCDIENKSTQPEKTTQSVSHDIETSDITVSCMPELNGDMIIDPQLLDIDPLLMGDVEGHVPDNAEVAQPTPSIQTDSQADDSLVLPANAHSEEGRNTTDTPIPTDVAAPPSVDNPIEDVSDVDDSVPGGRYPCPLAEDYDCPRTYSTKSVARSHARTHLRNKYIPCTFPGCNLKFAKHGYVKNHLWVHWGRRVASNRADADGICFCQKGLDEVGDVLQCANGSCDIGKFHMPCVGMKNPPEPWFCPICRVTAKIAESEITKEKPRLSSRQEKFIKSIQENRLAAAQARGRLQENRLAAPQVKGTFGASINPRSASTRLETALDDDAMDSTAMSGDAHTSSFHGSNVQQVQERLAVDRAIVPMSAPAMLQDDLEANNYDFSDDEDSTAFTTTDILRPCASMYDVRDLEMIDPLLRHESFYPSHKTSSSPTKATTEFTRDAVVSQHEHEPDDMDMLDVDLVDSLDDFLGKAKQIIASSTSHNISSIEDEKADATSAMQGTDSELQRGVSTTPHVNIVVSSRCLSTGDDGQGSDSDSPLSSFGSSRAASLLSDLDAFTPDTTTQSIDEDGMNPFTQASGLTFGIANEGVSKDNIVSENQPIVPIATTGQIAAHSLSSLVEDDDEIDELSLHSSAHAHPLLGNNTLYQSNGNFVRFSKSSLSRTRSPSRLQSSTGGQWYQDDDRYITLSPRHQDRSTSSEEESRERPIGSRLSSATKTRSLQIHGTRGGQSGGRVAKRKRVMFDGVLDDDEEDSPLRQRIV